VLEDHTMFNVHAVVNAQKSNTLATTTSICLLLSILYSGTGDWWWTSTAAVGCNHIQALCISL